MEKELRPILRTAMSQRRFKRLVGVKLALPKRDPFRKPVPQTAIARVIIVLRTGASGAGRCGVPVGNGFPAVRQQDFTHRASRRPKSGMTCSSGRRRRNSETAAEAVFKGDFSGRILAFDIAAADPYPELVRERRRGRPISPFAAHTAAIARTAGALLATRQCHTHRAHGCCCDQSVGSLVRPKTRTDFAFQHLSTGVAPFYTNLLSTPSWRPGGGAIPLLYSPTRCSPTAILTGRPKKSPREGALKSASMIELV
jgi:hypothetical protein